MAYNGPPEDQTVHAYKNVRKWECDVFCKCGKRNEYGFKKCVKCGRSLEDAKFPQQNKIKHEGVLEYVKRYGPLYIK